MRRIWTVARREYLATVKTKGFVVGLLLAPLLMSGSFVVMLLLKDQVNTTDRRIAIVDRTAWLTPHLVAAAQARNAKEVHDPKTGKKLRPAYQLEPVAPDNRDPEAQRLALSQRIHDGDLHAFVEIGSGILHPQRDAADSHIAYHAKNAALDDVRQWLGGPINDQLRQRRLTEAGVDPARFTNLFDWASIESMGLTSVDPKTGAVAKAKRRGELETIALPMIVTVLMFLILAVGVSPMLNAVMEEKAQRIAEVLLGSATPFELMLGKLLGGVGISLTASGLYLVAGLATVLSLAQEQLFQYSLFAWFLGYLLLAVLMLGSLAIALGSACNDAKEAQQLQLPVMLPMMLPMFMLGPVLKEPNSVVATVLSLFPPFTPVLMLLRLSLPGGVPAWQPWLGLLGTLLATLGTVWVAGRIFRVGILMQGKPPQFKEILRWAVRG